MLTDDQVRHFQDEGFIPRVPVMSSEEARDIRRKLEAFEAKQGGQLKPEQRSRAFLLFEWLDALIHDARVLDSIEQLIGPNILCWSSIFWIKEAGSKSFVDWHQDNTYWGLSSRNVITAWFAISDASEEAGCMSVIPRTHNGDALEHEDTYHQDNMLTRGQRIKTLDKSMAVPMPLTAGEMSLHNYCLAHGSGPNVSADRRMGVSLHFMPPQTQQIVGGWDCATLVRGVDDFNHFTIAPRPQCDMDPISVAFHEKASLAMREVLYAGAKQNLARL
jgi:non-heme Fe2+,alpha-ketoglutarate-dependent halogenase